MQPSRASAANVEGESGTNPVQSIDSLGAVAHGAVVSKQGMRIYSTEKLGPIPRKMKNQVRVNDENVEAANKLPCPFPNENSWGGDHQC